MQAVVQLAGAPVAAVQRFIGSRRNRRRHDGLAMRTGTLHHETVAERPRQRMKERAREIGLVAVPQERVAVQVEDLVERRAIERRA